MTSTAGASAYAAAHSDAIEKALAAMEQMQLTNWLRAMERRMM